MATKEDAKHVPQLIPLSEMPLKPRDWWYLLASSMEQLIGAALSTIAGIIIPLILLLGEPKLNAPQQGIIGSCGLIGIAAGSVIIGKLMDKMGYLLWFRLCPIIIAAGACAAYFSHTFFPLALSLFTIGIGVGGGYSLDSGYLSEIMPAKWQGLFVGLAKASASLGFIGGAAFSYLILSADPNPAIWPALMFFIAALGVLTFLMRLRWSQSPRWLLTKGEVAEAEKAAKDFMGPEAEVRPRKSVSKTTQAGWSQMFRGKSLDKVILSGITWACEGLGVYGFGVFLPILVMALGMQSGDATGIAKILDSVRTTTFINIFIGAGFALGLVLLHKVNIYRFMGWNFILSAAALIILLIAFKLHWPVWISFLCFVIFEVALNAGPHLITYIIPAKIYNVEERGAGTGIATMLGKIGAVMGVFFMPALLDWGGMTLVLGVSIVVMLLGAAVTFVYAKRLDLL